MRNPNQKKRAENPPELPVPILRELLNQPLSVLFNDLLREGLSGPVRDLDGWVHRPPDTRIDEAREKGKESRPMNAFMLYRFAYQKLVKEYLSRKNYPAHGQAISRTIGLGWRSETEAIRRKYEDLANIERRNYLALYPKANHSIAKRCQQRKKRAPSLHITSHVEAHSHMVYSEDSQDSESEMSSPSSEGSELWLDLPNASTRGATCDCRATSAAYPSPWLLGETLGEIGNLRALGFENVLPGEPEFELNSHSQYTGYIDPRLLTRGEASLRT
ncbi:hypothetical protein N7448_011411 [Penicillium atrosanguineum]|nr:hypothetical protein N7448_011411 [Penicillium atrosanguineum]